MGKAHQQRKERDPARVAKLMHRAQKKEQDRCLAIVAQLQNNLAVMPQTKEIRAARGALCYVYDVIRGADPVKAAEERDSALVAVGGESTTPVARRKLYIVGAE